MTAHPYRQVVPYRPTRATRKRIVEFENAAGVFMRDWLEEHTKAGCSTRWMADKTGLDKMTVIRLTQRWGIALAPKPIHQARERGFSIRGRMEAEGLFNMQAYKRVCQRLCRHPGLTYLQATADIRAAAGAAK